MASGVAVHPDCLSTFQELKLRKKSKYIIFNLNNLKTEIIVEKKSSSTNYDEFLAELSDEECKWAVYDFEYDSGEGTRNKLLFISWSPDTAKIRQKMLFASSKDALKRSLQGVAVEIQGTEISEVTREAIEKRL